MKQSLIPAPGRVVVHREQAAEFYSYRRSAMDSDEDSNLVNMGNGTYEHIRSPWGLVVGVGKSETTMYGTKITTDIEPGDFVACANVGMDIPLEAGDGTLTYVYSLSFDGIIGRLEAVCDAPGCDYRDRKNPRILICPKCGAGPAVEIVPAGANEIAAVQASRVRR